MGRLDGPSLNFWAQLGPKHNSPIKITIQTFNDAQPHLAGCRRLLINKGLETTCRLDHRQNVNDFGGLLTHVDFSLSKFLSSKYNIVGRGYSFF